MRVAFVIFFFLALYTGHAQDTLSCSTLSAQQYSSWKNIEQAWLNENYYPFLKKEKIKLSCAHCGSVSLSVVFSKDSITTTSNIVSTHKCGTEFKGKQLEELKALLRNISLPTEFDNKKFKVILGQTLKC